MRHINAILITTLALLVSGCSGIEIGGKAWIQKIDESQSSQRTYAQPPLKCLFVNCGQSAEMPSEEVK
jgi:starvation-inducible outer membrane lipoprotein